jgi:branched-chain amino acid transport system substrate-binding protein
MRTEFARALAIAALATAAAGCGGGGTGTNTIRIGMLSDCNGPYSSLYDATAAGAELPFLRRGGKLRGPNPSDGVEGASIAGKRVELVLGCEGDTFGTTLAETRRLVEQKGVNVIVAPLAVPYASALKQYARRRLGTVFSIALSGEQGATMKQPAPNVFRFSLDNAQAMAGLGAYAYRQLGWRTAVTIGEDEAFGWSEAAGFAAEFCALGGKVVKRLWSPFYSAALAHLASEIPSGVDGIWLGGGNQDYTSFFAAYGRLHPDLSNRMIADGIALEFGTLRARLLGVVAGQSYPFDSKGPAWVRYMADFRRAFPGVQGGSIFDLAFYDATEPVLEALGQVHGDLSHGEQKLMAALAGVRFESPTGAILLDRNRQAVGPAFLSRVVKDGRGKLVLRTFRVVPNVEQTFNGYFGPSTPEPSRAEPACKRGNPPTWAR